MATGWNGLGVGLANVWRLADAETRSISPENPTGEPGRGGMDVEGVASHANAGLGQGWKVCPSVTIAPGAEHVLADIEGSGAIQHIWLTPTGGWRNQILRMYWDDDPQPAVECPVGDFFACGWGEYAQVSSLAVCVNPGSAFNCYWEMPFQRRARITLTNESDEERILYYQITYSLCAVPDDAARFCAQFRRVNPLAQGDVVTILDGVQGRGQYVGTYCAWGVNNSGWWGEGEVKFFLDGDGEFPTICGTGTEDYFCGSYNFDVDGQYTRVHDAVRRHAPSAAPRRHLPVTAALRAVPLAPHRPDPVHERPAGDDAGPRLAPRLAATSSSRTTSPPSPTGTRRSRSRPIRRSPTATPARSSDLRHSRWARPATPSRPPRRVGVTSRAPVHRPSGSGPDQQRGRLRVRAGRPWSPCCVASPRRRRGRRRLG